MFTALKLVSSILPLLPKDKIKCKGTNCPGADRSFVPDFKHKVPATAGELALMPPPPPGQKYDHYKTCGLPASPLRQRYVASPSGFCLCCYYSL